MSSPPIDRRTLIKASAAAATTASVLAHTRAGSQTTPKPAPIHIGLLGCGGRGTGAASDALHADPNTIITAMGDCLPDRLQRSHTALLAAHPGRIHVPNHHRFIGFDALDHLLATDIDVILLATPPHWRPAQIAASITAGKHVFAEKPAAVDAPGVRSVLASAALARTNNLSLASGFCWRSSFPEREIYRRIHAGAIGSIRAVYATYNGSPNGFVARTDAMSDMEHQIRNWFHFQWLSGDHIVEQAVHSIDKIAWAMNDVPPLRCWAVGGRQQRRDDHPGDIFDHFSVTYEYTQNRRAFLMARQWEDCPNDNTDWVYGEKGIARINGWGPEHWIRTDDAGGESGTWRYSGETPNMYVREHEELFAGIRNGRPLDHGTWMAHSTLMAIMGRMAAYTGEAVTWEQALASTERLGPTEYAFGPVATTSVPRPGRARAPAPVDADGGERR